MMTKTEDLKPKTSEANEVAGVILAAGRSERMRAFKPLLPFGDKTVIETCIDHFREAGVESVIVVLSEGPRAEEMKDYLKDSRVELALNPNPTSEMSASIACGVRQLPLQSKVVVITPADHPAVPSDVVATLIAEWKKGARLVVPTWNGRGGHPVLVDLTFREELLNLDSDRGLRSLFDTHRGEVKRISVNSNYVARDMDTWDDYRALHQDVFGVPPPEKVVLEQQ